MCLLWLSSQFAQAYLNRAIALSHVWQKFQGSVSARLAGTWIHTAGTQRLYRGVNKLVELQDQKAEWNGRVRHTASLAVQTPWCTVICISRSNDGV